MYQTTNNQNDTNTATTTYRFYGLDRTRRPSRGAMEDMRNMSSGEFPCAAPAPSRAAVVSVSKDIQATAAPDSSVSDTVTGLTGVMDGAFYYNGVKKSRNTILRSDYNWTIARLSKVYILNGIGASGKAAFTYNADTDEFRPLTNTMDRLIVTAGQDNYGNYLETYRYRHSAVSDHQVTLDDGSRMLGDDFFDKYKSYETESNIFAGCFQVGDEIEISGFPADEPGGRLWYYDGSSGDGGEVRPVATYNVSYNNTVDMSAARMSGIDNDDIVHAAVKRFEVTVAGYRYAHRIYFELLDKTGAQNEFRNMLNLGTNNANYYAQGVTLRLAYPAFTDIAVHDGRIWGTTANGEYIYGSSSDNIGNFSGESVNEKLAIRLTPDIPGKFTGICEYGSYLLAFKESTIILIYGSTDAGYRQETMQGIGCIDPKSIAVTPQGVIFLSYKGFFIYSGSTPRLISDKLNMQYTAAVAGYDGNIYYASALRADGVRELLAYDMRYGTWHIRDDFEALGMFRFRGGFYLADKRKIYTESGEPEAWSFTLARATDNTLDNKTVNEIWIYVDVSAGAEFTVYTDVSDGGWRQHTTFTDTGLKLFRCPIRALSGTNYRIRIEGHGKAVFYEIEVKESDQKGRRYKER